MIQGGTKDMTNGSPIKLILGFGIPLLFGMLFQQLYSTIDTMIVGRCLGVNELAAVGSTGAINFMIIGFCMGVCNGFAIPIAQNFGAKDYAALRRNTANSAWLSVVFSAVLTVFVCILCRNILTWMKTPEAIFEDAHTYIFIIFLGIPATFLYNMTSGIIRSMGDSKVPLIFLVISSVINIFLDLFTIIVLHMGVAGASLATVISQLISGIACLVYMKKKFSVLHMEREEWKWDSRYAARLCRMGVPMGLQYSITAIGSVMLQTAVNTLGAVAVAAVTAANKVVAFAWSPFDAMGSTMATYSGQNIGAGEVERINRGVKSCILIAAVYSVVAVANLYFFGEELSAIFIDPSEAFYEDIIQMAWLFLVINGAAFMLLSLVNIIRFTIQGLGYSELAIFAGVCEMAGRGVVAFLLVPAYGYPAVCLANSAAWILADIFLFAAYLWIMKHLKIRYGVKKLL